MQPNNNQVLTQEDLVEKLRQLGYDDASVTCLAHWRKMDLLPQFSSGGHGQGRGAGREKKHWSNPTEVIERAVAIMDLRNSYRCLEELYLPLWEMGFAIPLERVRPSLLQPLLTAAQDFDVQENGRSAVEDVIDQSVADLSPLIERHIPFFDVPDDSLAAVINVMANPHYAFWDQPYEDGVSKLKEWESTFAQRCQKLLGESIVIDPKVMGDDNNIFANAPFINRYLSLPHLVAAAQDCTDEELMVVQRDLRIARQLLLVLKRTFELLSPFVPEVFRFSSIDMTVIFGFGRLVIWADLALRRSGFGPLLDQLLPRILDQLHQDFNEAAERELQAAGPEIGKALQMVEQIIVTQFSAVPNVEPRP